MEKEVEDEFYAPGLSATIKLYLRRTLVLQQFCSAFFVDREWSIVNK